MKKSKYFIVLLNYILLSLLIIFSTVVPILSFIALFYAIYLIAIEDEIRLFSCVLFLLSFSNIFKSEFTGTFSYINIIYIVYLIKLIIIYITRKYKINTKSIVLMLLFLAYLILDISGFSTNTLSFILFMLLLILILNITGNLNLDDKSLFMAFISGIIISSILLPLTSSFIDYTRFDIFVKYRFDADSSFDRFSAFVGNPNYFSLNINIAISSLMYLFIDNRIKGSFYILTPLMIILGLMSASKSFIIVFIVTLVLFVIIIAKKRFELLLKIILIFTPVLLFLYLFLAKDFIDNATMRFVAEFSDITDITKVFTYRDVILGSYINFFYLNPISIIFGLGLNTTLINGLGSHNFYIEMIYHFGIIGTALLYFSIKNSFKIIYRVKFYMFLSMITLLIRGASINLITRDNFIFYIFLVVLPFVHTNRMRGSKN